MDRQRFQNLLLDDNENDDDKDNKFPDDTKRRYERRSSGDKPMKMDEVVASGGAVEVQIQDTGSTPAFQDYLQNNERLAQLKTKKRDNIERQQLDKKPWLEKERERKKAELRRSKEGGDGDGSATETFQFRGGFGRGRPESFSNSAPTHSASRHASSVTGPNRNYRTKESNAASYPQITQEHRQRFLGEQSEESGAFSKSEGLQKDRYHSRRADWHDRSARGRETRDEIRGRGRARGNGRRKEEKRGGAHSGNWRAQLKDSEEIEEGFAKGNKMEKDFTSDETLDTECLSSASGYASRYGAAHSGTLTEKAGRGKHFQTRGRGGGRGGGFNSRVGEKENSGVDDHDSNTDRRDDRQGDRRPFRGGERGGYRGGQHAEHRGRFTHASNYAGARRGPYHRKNTYFSLERILKIDTAPDMTLALTNGLHDFEDLVSSEVLPHEDILDILKVFSFVSDCQLYRQNVDRILQVICNSRMLDLHLATIITYLQDPDLEEEKVADVVGQILCLINAVCHRRTSYASKAFLPLKVLSSMPTVTAALKNCKPELVDGMKTALEDVEQCMNMLQNAARQKQKGAVRFRRWAVNNDDDDIPPEDFVLLPILPDDKDMVWTEKPFLRANKEEGSFRDVAHYLDVQFRLLREDYIRPIRKGLQQYTQLKAKGEKIGKIDDLRLYYNVRILEPVCKNSLEHRLQFDISRMKKVRWQSSRRFTFGSLLCLSTDDFETRLFATVTDRQVQDLEQGIVQVKFEECLEEILDCSGSEVFSLAETTSAFFEAYRHVLEGLQEFGVAAHLPLDRYLVQCNKQVKPPIYLLTGEPLPKMNLRSLLSKTFLQDLDDDDGLTTIRPGTTEVKMDDDERRTSSDYDDDLTVSSDDDDYQAVKVIEEKPNLYASCVSIINPKTWPSAEDTFLNESQYAAVQIALSKELAIIQGPPGTGKTFVGLKVTKILLENAAAWTDPDKPKPILVVCYTNHALDQFLEGILEFCPQGIVRVGTRCKNEALAKFNLKELRFAKRRGQWAHSRKTDDDEDEEEKEGEEELNRNIRTCENTLASTKDRIDRSSKSLEMSTKSIVSEAPLREFIGAEHFRQLRGFCTDTSTSEMSIMADWLTILLKGGQEESGEVEEKSIDPTAVHALPHHVRAQLYRLWLPRARQYLQHMVNVDIKAGKKPDDLIRWLMAAQRYILPDMILGAVINRGLYAAIKKGAKDEPFAIRDWLGFEGNPDDTVAAVQELIEPTKVAESAEDDVDDYKEDFDDDDDDPDAERKLDDDEIFFSAKDTPSQPSAEGEKGPGAKREQTRRTRGQTTEGEWSDPKLHRGQQKKELLKLIESSTPMSEEEAKSITNLWNPDFKVQDRVRLYKSWLVAHQEYLRQSVKTSTLAYADDAKRMQELRFGEDKSILEKARIIGMTTTGAARYRSVLNEVACPIIIIEEAAEVLEGHVVTTLHRQIQHLILIGDHQQLRPSPTVFDLCRRYKLDLSLFERLVNNGLPHATLAVQHRMRPEIARLVRHVYPDLQDHTSTLTRPHIRGMKQDVFFCHHEFEEVVHDETSSKSNLHEAELCVRLCRYLLQQGYDPSTITILTAYTGQVLVLKGIFSHDKQTFSGVRVAVVDNYQGEENDVIILSLVRNNEEQSVGFLGTDNRVCVALSRAKNGFYAFGNFKMLMQKSELWKNVIKTAREHEQFGEALVLRCENHPATEVHVKCAKDFDNAPEGGCQLPCGTRLDCGHVCVLLCHGYDREHQAFKCRKPCERQICDFDHKCPKHCFEKCGNCLFRVQKEVPGCGHVQTIACFLDPDTYECQQPCTGTLECGHQCTGRCGACKLKGRHVNKCQTIVEKTWPCGHVVRSTCYVPPGDLPCRHPCLATLDCGHKCVGTCGECWGGRVHVACKARCGKPRDGCGHPCPTACGLTCLPCEEKCPEVCYHGECPSTCGQPCPPCVENCPWVCQHRPHRPCRNFCNAPCQPCGKPCRLKMQCGHWCKANCGEECVCLACNREYYVPLDRDGKTGANADWRLKSNTRLVMLWDCWHIFKVDALDFYVDRQLKTLPLNAPVPCPACPTPIYSYSTWRYASRLATRHLQQQEAKTKLVSLTAVTETTIDKIRRNTFYCSVQVSEFLAHALKGDGVDRNLAFALEKRAAMTLLLKRVESAHQKNNVPADVDLLVLKRFVENPLGSLTRQQYLDLTKEVKIKVIQHACAAAATELDRMNECISRMKQKLGYVPSTLKSLPQALETKEERSDDMSKKEHEQVVTEESPQDTLSLLEACKKATEDGRRDPKSLILAVQLVQELVYDHTKRITLMRIAEIRNGLDVYRSQDFDKEVKTTVEEMVRLLCPKKKPSAKKEAKEVTNTDGKP